MTKTLKKRFFQILIISVLCLVFGVAAIFASRHLGGWDAIREGLTSSLVNSEAVFTMIALAALVLMSLGMLCAYVIFLSRPLLRKYRLERQERKKIKSSDSRFPGLKEIDARLREQPAPSYDDPTLEELCTNLQSFAASRLGLYYDIADIRRFVAGMGVSHLVILRGMSGTGKTSLAYAAGEYFGISSLLIPIQPMWKERSDMLGYFNEFSKRFNETKLLSGLYEAGGTEGICIAVLDEMNIARIEYYFAEFLSLLEIPDPEKRKLAIVPDSWPTDPERIVDGKLTLPPNVWFVGTANNDDSTFSISDKVYDRASILDLERKCAPFSAPDTSPANIRFTRLQERFEQAKASAVLSGESRQALLELDDFLTDRFRISFGNRIMRQIEEYVPIMLACGGTEAGALDDMLTRKLLRKLEQASPALLHRQIPELQDTLSRLFGQDSMPQCRAYLSRLNATI